MSLPGPVRARYGGRFLLRADASAGRITPKAEWVGEALLTGLSPAASATRGYDTLVVDAGCSARTARRATVSMRDLGLLRWEQRLVRTGWRAEQTSNANELMPTAAALPVGGTP